MVGSLAAAELNPPQAPVSLPDLVTDTLSTNPELEFYRDQIGVAEGQKRTARTWENPELSISGGYKRAESIRDDVSAEGTAWSVSVSQKFDFAGRIGLRKAIAERDVKLAELGLDQFRLALAARVRELGFKLFAAQSRLESRRELAERFESLREVVLQRDPAGVTPRLEARILEASALIHQRQAVDAELELKDILAEINLLRGLPAAKPLRIARPEFRFGQPTNTVDLIVAAWRWNFDLKLREMELEQQGFRVKLAEREKHPELTVEPFYSSETAFDREHVVGIGLKLPLPLWDRNRGAVLSAEARQRQAQTMVTVFRRELERDIHKAAGEYSARLDEMNRWPADVMEHFQTAAAEGDEHYRLGALPIGTYITLQEQSIEALESLLETQTRAVQAGEQLQLLTGIPFITLEQLSNEGAK